MKRPVGRLRRVDLADNPSDYGRDVVDLTPHDHRSGKDRYLV